ncbi:MAG: LamG domain-containing protein, partial [Acidobacteriota bacterium]
THRRCSRVGDFRRSVSPNHAQSELMWHSGGCGWRCAALDLTGCEELSVSDWLQLIFRAQHTMQLKYMTLILCTVVLLPTADTHAQATATGWQVVEYLDTADFPSSPGGHFFYSADPVEQSFVDGGGAGRFARTGKSFNIGGPIPVCRFYGSVSPGPNSHFFTADGGECAALKALQKTPIPADVQQWNFEGAGFTTDVPTSTAAGSRSCPQGSQSVYRAYNNAYTADGRKNPWDSNHRFAVDHADINAMATGYAWRDEGIVLCAATYAAPPTQRYLVYDGTASYAEVPSSPDLSPSSTGITVEAWMRPDTLMFPHTEGSLATEQYVHWLGKGQSSQQEWTFRMYSATNPPGPRQNRVSFYVFNASGGRGCGSYFQDPLAARQWVQVVGVADQGAQTTSIYKNGALRHSDSFAGIITPVAGSAPLRFGSKDFASFFQGAIGPVRVWNRPLNAAEVQALYVSNVVPQNGLVAQYLLTEGSGNVAHDTARGHDGNVIGAQWGAGGGPVNITGGNSGGGC